MDILAQVVGPEEGSGYEDEKKDWAKGAALWGSFVNSPFSSQSIIPDNIKRSGTKVVESLLADDNCGNLPTLAKRTQIGLLDDNPSQSRARYIVQASFWPIPSIECTASAPVWTWAGTGILCIKQIDAIVRVSSENLRALGVTVASVNNSLGPELLGARSSWEELDKAEWREEGEDSYEATEAFFGIIYQELT
ncbi:hypothetical protein BGX38DRAFT_1273367 [Terfezia claveryi]|nr:hypothetical protein BGX38DRAFT_1273367 [Terfezia claveryi]